MDMDLLLDARLWADGRGRALDVEVLRALLELRETYDELEPHQWPAGSIEDLLTRLWPAKADRPAPDPRATADSLASFVTFLRNTGRMWSRSADPKTLAAEARRAAPQMAELAADRAQWSSTKVLLEHAAASGFDLSRASSPEQANVLMQQATEQWNSLPQHERVRLMPHPGEEDTSGFDRAREAFGPHDLPVLLCLSMAPELPQELQLVNPEVPTLVAESLLFRRVRTLAQAAGDGLPVTATGVPRLAPARDLIAALGLDGPPGEHEVTGPPPDRLRSAWDSPALRRTWLAAAACGAITVGRTKAVGHPLGQLGQEEILQRGLQMVMQILLYELEDHLESVTLLYGLLRSHGLGRAAVPWTEVADFYSSWWYPTSLHSHTTQPDWRQRSLERIRPQCQWLAETNLVKMDAHGLALTPFGDVTVETLVSYLLDTSRTS